MSLSATDKVIAIPIAIGIGIDIAIGIGIDVGTVTIITTIRRGIFLHAIASPSQSGEYAAIRCNSSL